MDKKVTFYIPCYNAEKTLERAVCSVWNQTFPVQDFFVVDDASTDRSRLIANRLGVKVIRHKKNQGLAAARNTALKHCSTPFIASIDSDVELEPQWLEWVMSGFTGASIAGAGGRLLEKYTLTAVDRWRQAHLCQDKGKRRKPRVPYLVGAESVYRTSALKKAKGFDPRFRTNFEDYDMGVRLNQLGFQLIHEPKALARHLKTDDLDSLLRTYRNWSLPFHHLEKRLHSISGIQAQIGLHHIRNNRTLLEKDIRLRRFHLLYPSFLLLFTEIIKDLDQFVASHPSFAPLKSFAPGIIFPELKKNGNMDPRLFRHVSNDLSAHLKNSGLDGKGSMGSDIRKAVSKNFPGIDPLTLTSVGATLEILRSALESRLLEISRETYSQILTSANEIHHEKKNPPYRRHGFPRPGCRVLLANPPWRSPGKYGVRAGSRWPHMEPFNSRLQVIPDYIPFPFFLAYGASLLKKLKGATVWIVDAIAEGLDEETFLERVRGFDPHVMVIETSAASSKNDLRFAARMKAVTGPSAKMIFTGPHVTSLKEAFLLENRNTVDYLILGEYEISLKKLVACLVRKKRPTRVPGVLYLEKGRVTGSNQPAPLVDIDRLPPPERLTLPVYNYRDRFGGMPELSVQMMTSRGCPYQCIFCCWPQTLYAERRYRFQNPKKVAEEMKRLVRDFGFQAVYFDDDTFNIGKKRLLHLCSEIQQRKMDVPWAIMARADTSDEETLKTMKEAGLYAAKFGVESGSQKLLDACGKNLDLKQVRETVRLCKKLGIKTHLTFALGLPGETETTIRQTVDFALKARPHSAQFSIITPYPGTKIFHMLEEAGRLVTKDWSRYDGACGTVFRTGKFSPADLEEAVKKAGERYHMGIAKGAFNARLGRFVKGIREKRERIGLFPAGLFSRLFAEKYGLSSNGRAFFFDNDPGKTGKKIHGIPILSPEEIAGVRPRYLLLLHPAFEQDIFRQVRHLQGEDMKIIKIFEEFS